VWRNCPLQKLTLLQNKQIEAGHKAPYMVTACVVFENQDADIGNLWVLAAWLGLPVIQITCDYRQ
jgi:hypothetical protein